MSGGLVLVGEQVGRAVDELGGCLVAVHPRQLLGGVSGEGEAADAALLGVPVHRLGVVGADEHQVEAAQARSATGCSSISRASLIAPA